MPAPGHQLSLATRVKVFALEEWVYSVYSYRCCGYMQPPCWAKLSRTVACSGAQFSALPGALTGREVLRMYARLRGVPGALTEAAVEELLQRIDLAEYADRWEGGLLACMHACLLTTQLPTLAIVMRELHWRHVPGHVLHVY